MTPNLLSIARQAGRDIILRLGGFNAKPSNGIHILNGHMSHRTKPSLEYMERTVEHLTKVVKLIRIEDAIKMIENRETVNQPLCAFTFDDGFEECYDCIAPVLEKNGVNAIFFVNPNFIDGDDAYIRHFTEETVRTPNKKPMRWTQLKDLKNRGFIIGAHTMDHYLTASNDKKELEYQIVDCKHIIEDRLGGECDYFAWPYGKLEHTNNYAVDLACKTYKHVFSQSDYRHYFSFNGKVINRRHFEPFWPISHIKFFLSRTISF